METAWLRRRPSRFTGDKFVCVSWAATLGSRTLTRSCQREGKSRPSTSSALPPTGTPTPPLLLSACVAPSNRPSGRRQTPPGAEAFLWDLALHPRSPPTPPVCTVEVPKTHWHTHTHSQNSRKHTMGPQDDFPCPTEKIMDAGVWQRRRTTYENTVLGAASALFGFFCLWNGFRGNTSAGKLMICHVKSGTKHPTVETRRSWAKPKGGEGGWGVVTINAVLTSTSTFAKRYHWLPVRPKRTRWKTWHGLKCHRKVSSIWWLWSKDNGAFTSFYLLLRLYINQAALVSVI